MLFLSPARQEDPAGLGAHPEALVLVHNSRATADVVAHDLPPLLTAVLPPATSAGTEVGTEASSASAMLVSAGCNDVAITDTARDLLRPRRA